MVEHPDWVADEGGELRVEEKYYTVIVGRDRYEDDNYPEFLIAPENYYFNVGDVVISRGGHEYTVKFVNTYTSTKSQLYQALEEALGDPVRIATKVISEEVKWGDEDETDTDTTCGSDCRSGEWECGDGDGSIIYR